jgi:PAS domain S-box-containing protein
MVAPREPAEFGTGLEGDTLDPDARPTIALGLDNGRNRELLAGLLSAYETTDAADGIGATTDLCVVDPGGFSRLESELERWKRQQRPAAAPVLLLGNADENALWNEYADAMGEKLNAIQSIPAPKRAVLMRVRGLLETRRYSLAARERHERLELYERAMDGASVGITVADADDPERPLIYANDGFLEITGYDRSEVLGRNCRFLQGEGTDRAAIDRIREALDAEEPVSVEIRNYRKSGEPFWNDLDIMPVTDGSGEVTHFLGFQQNVTDRKRRMLVLRRYEQVIQSVDDPILVVDADRRVELSNAAASTVFGDTDVADVALLFPPDARAAVREALSSVERTGAPEERQIEFGGPDEPDRIYQFRFQPERNGPEFPSDPDGSTSQIVVIGRDVTKLREYQSRLSVLDRVLRHNLRNKLTIISGNTRLIAEADTDSPELVAGALDRIDGAVEDLLGLAESARQFHRSIEPGTRSGAAVDVGDLVAETVGSARKQFPEADIRTDIPESLTAVCPETIRLGIQQIIENAVVHADSPEPRIRITATELEDAIELRIADDGPGLPAREREALGRGAETSLEHLQGISLWLVSWAIRSVGGTFEVRDNDPTGTVVVLRLPREEP